MKSKFTEILALVLSAAVLLPGLSSCQKDAEEMVGSGAPGNGAISFGMAFETPSQDLTTKGSFELTDDEGNVVLMMGEEVFDTPVPDQTKATLIDDVAHFYTSFQVSGFLGTSPYDDITNQTVSKQSEKYPDESHEKWTLSSTKTWPGSSDLEFFAWAPADAWTTAQDFTLTPNESGTGIASFNYTVSDATVQKDIMMARYYGNGKNNELGGPSVPVNGVATMKFSHALSSVTFKAGEGLDNIKINSITLEDIGKTASCTATFVQTSSGDAAYEGTTTYNWDTPSETGDYTRPYTPSGIEPKDLDPTKTTGATFIVIPQTFGASSTARIVLNITCGGVTYNVSSKLADASADPARTTTWKAGKTTVYTINYGDVGVSIEDEVTDQNVKQNLVITNSGGVKAYIRAVIVANWCDEDGNVVASWKDATPTGFTGFPGTDWVSGTDGYYYYKHPVAPTKSPALLFETYTPPVSPVDGAHLEMSIVTQSVIWDEDMVNAKAAWGPEMGTLLEIE